MLATTKAMPARLYIRGVKHDRLEDDDFVAAMRTIKAEVEMMV